MVEGAKEAILQMINGRDFDPPEKMLSRVKSEKAVEGLPGFPYTLATNVRHADFWNEIWLARLEGRKGPSITEDWAIPTEEEWPSVREQFLKNLDRVRAIASAEPFQHKMSSDGEAAAVLIQIAVHTAYHLGQIRLMKRVMRLKASKP